MATIVNARDALLQATSPRLIDVFLPGNIIPETARGISLSPTTGVFKTNASGSSTTPLSISLVLTRRFLTNTATFTVTEGTATLTGSGDTRTLTFANMSSDKITVRASVTENSVTYTTDSIVVKVKDGANGTNGTDGTNGIRGSVDLYVIGSSWSDTVANNAITTQTGSSTKYAGDKVTIYNNAGFAETRYWDGISAWVTGQIINGNILVTGTVTSNAIGTNVLTAVGVNTTQYMRAYGLFGVGVNGAAIVGENTTHAGYAILGNTTSGTGTGAVSGVVNGNGHGINGSSTAGIGVRARGGPTGVDAEGSATGVRAVATGVAGVGLYADGGVGGPAIHCDGSLQFGPTTINPPPGTATNYLDGSGNWKRPNLSDILPNIGDTPSFEFSTDGGATWTTILLRRI